MNEMTMREISRLCKNYADACDGLEELIHEIRTDQRRAVRTKMRRLVTVADHKKKAEDELRSALEDAPELFEKPRTRAIEGIKVGYRKLPGKAVVEDEERLVELIRKKLPDREDALVRTKVTVDKAALKNLTVRQLASIGVTLSEDTDEIVIQAAQTDLDKLVAVLFADDEEAAG